MTPIRVVLVDDYPLVRTGLAGMLANADEINIVGEAENGRQGLTVIAELAPDVVLLDLRMPEMDGPELIKQLRSQNSPAGVLVLTTYDTDADIVRAIEAGANGYLLKDTTRDELIRAIIATHAGESWLAPSVAQQIMTSIRSGDIERLSSRELEVLNLVGVGRSNKEIAAELHLSTATVKTHLIHIFRKLDVNDRTAAVTVAIGKGII